MSSGTPDFSLLSNKAYDYVDLKKAKVNGLNDNEIASVAKIAEKTGYSFKSLSDEVLRGNTFAFMAVKYGLKLDDVLDVSAEKDKIAAYEAAYESTGSMALKNMAPMSSMPMSSSSTMPMSSSSTAAPMAPTKDIVDTAMSDKRFKTLVKALKAANLVDTLKGPGPFTVFAPTDAAFKKLPKGALKDLMKNPDQLAMVLKYHVLGAKVDAATAMAMTSPTSPPTVEGSTLQVTSSGGTVKVNDATVVQADIMATNGIIHAIDTVLMPPDMPAPSTPASDTTGTSAPMSTTPTTPAAPGTDTTAPTGGTSTMPTAPTPGSATPGGGGTGVPGSTTGTGTATP